MREITPFQNDASKELHDLIGKLNFLIQKAVEIGIITDIEKVKRMSNGIYHPYLLIKTFIEI